MTDQLTPERLRQLAAEYATYYREDHKLPAALRQAADRLEAARNLVEAARKYLKPRMHVLGAEERTLLVALEAGEDVER